MPDYDFSGLTPRQEWLLLYQGWRVGQRFPDGSPWPQPQRRTVRKLINRGLMTATASRATHLHDHGIELVVTEYHVPIHIHMAFCLSCGSKESSHA